MEVIFFKFIKVDPRTKIDYEMWQWQMSIYTAKKYYYRVFLSQILCGNSSEVPHLGILPRNPQIVLSSVENIVCVLDTFKNSPFTANHCPAVESVSHAMFKASVWCFPRLDTVVSSANKFKWIKWGPVATLILIYSKEHRLLS